MNGVFADNCISIMHFHFVALLPYSSIYATHTCDDGSSALLHTLQCIQDTRALLPQNFTIDSSTLLITECDENNTIDTNQFPKDIVENFKIVKIPHTIKALVDALYHIVEKDQGTKGHICFMQADSMFSYAPLYVKMMDTHTKYHAHYTRSEGYPLGIMPEILSYNACKMMKFTTEETLHADFANTAITRESIFNIIEKHINDYDIEAHLAPHDMRLLRLSLCADVKSSFIVGKKLWDVNLRNPDDLMSFYKTHTGLFRGIPKYIYVQLSDADYHKIYTVNNNNKTDVHYINDTVVDVLVHELAQFAEDAVLCVGFLGEVLAHPKIFELLTKFSKSYSKVYVETQGSISEGDWDLQNTWWDKVPKNVLWIIYLDAIKEETYKRISGIKNTGDTGSFSKVLQFIEFLKTKTSGKNIFVQATRMPENEEELDQFCKHWDTQGVTPLIQKYNDICKILPDKKVVDIAPIKRFACRHLQRDMVIGFNGDVYLCFQDVQKKHVLGNITKNSVEELWHTNESDFVDHVQNKYKQICKDCDEYYTCNE